MIDVEQFRDWLESNTDYTPSVVSDNISRLKRANSILEVYDDEIYLFYLEHTPTYKLLTTSVRSQIKRAVKLYFKFKQVSME